MELGILAGASVIGYLFSGVLIIIYGLYLLKKKDDFLLKIYFYLIIILVVIKILSRVIEKL